MVVTMLEAAVDPERAQDLQRAFGDAAGALPRAIVETFLLHAVDSDVWRIVTVWRSGEELDAYRASVDTPEGVRMFRAAGAQPTLTIFEVASRAGH